MLFEYTPFFYKNIFYKVIEAESVRNFKSILTINPRREFEKDSVWFIENP